jgi:hypothetical protein
MSGIAEALEKLIPQSLGDVVRQNRHLVQIGLATPEELAERAATIASGQAKDTINGWRMIAFRIPRPPADKQLGLFEKCRLSMIGWAVELRCVRITSHVLRIDVGNGLVQTRNSLYRLGVRGEGEPSRDELIHVCAALNSWGLGQDLGVAEFFF